MTKIKKGRSLQKKLEYDERYKNGKIYYIYCKTTDSIYVGSTCVRVKKRIIDHKYDMMACLGLKNNKLQRAYRTSSEVLYNDNYIYGVLEHISCNNKYELEIREGLWIKAFKANPNINIVNKANPAGHLNTIIPYYYFCLPPAVIQCQASF